MATEATIYGQAAVIDLIFGKGKVQQGIPVFGCPLFAAPQPDGGEVP